MKTLSVNAVNDCIAKHCNERGSKLFSTVRDYNGLVSALLLEFADVDTSTMTFKKQPYMSLKPYHQYESSTAKNLHAATRLTIKHLYAGIIIHSSEMIFNIPAFHTIFKFIYDHKADIKHVNAANTILNGTFGYAASAVVSAEPSVIQFMRPSYVDDIVSKGNMISAKVQDALRTVVKVQLDDIWFTHYHGFYEDLRKSCGDIISYYPIEIKTKQTIPQ